MRDEIIQGSVLDAATWEPIPDQHVQCCITSPPYWGLRDYGVEGQLGLERTPEEFVSRMVEVFRHVRRVLRDAGTLWLNLGDSYCSATSERNPLKMKGATGCVAQGTADANPTNGRGDRNRRLMASGIKMKDLVGIPWMVAFALRADGWYLRQDIIWHKPNPMPESVHDRCTKAHEYLFLLTKKPRYFCDMEAIKEPLATPAHAPGNKKLDASRNDQDQMGKVWGSDGKRNKRSVWTVATKPYKEAHFATFPPKLIEPCVLAGCPAGGIVFDPFMGSGTTGMVARQHGRDYLGIELNPEYAKMARERIAVATEPGYVSRDIPDDAPLFV